MSYYPRPQVDPVTGQTETIAEQQKHSYLGRLGQFVEPVMEPLGFNWKVDIALLSGVAAKEIVVSTIGVLYAGESDLTEDDASLRERLTMPNPETGNSDFTPLIALTFLVFVLLYFPCLASVAAIVKETGSWGWGIFSHGVQYGICLGGCVFSIQHRKNYLFDMIQQVIVIVIGIAVCGLCRVPCGANGKGKSFVLSPAVAAVVHRPRAAPMR